MALKGHATALTGTLTLGLMLAFNTQAADVYFQPDAILESFDLVSNWTTCPPSSCTDVPGVGDAALFYDGLGSFSAYTVVFPTVVSNQRMRVAGADVTFDLNGLFHTLTASSQASPSLQVGLASPFGTGTASTLTLTNGQLRSVSTGIGMEAGYTGTVNVGAGAVLINSDFISVGDIGTGTLQITNGGEVTAFDGMLGNNSGASGSVSVSGLGSTFSVFDRLSVGGFGTSDLTVSNSGWINGNTIDIAANATATGTVTVTGMDSLLTGTLLSVGGSELAGGGTGSLMVSNSGLVDLRDTLRVWESGTVNVSAGGEISADDFQIDNGSVTVSGSGSRLSVVDDLRVSDVSNGSGASATLLVTDGGSLSSKDGFIAPNLGTFGAVEVSGSGSSWSSNNIDVGFIGGGAGALTVSNGAAVDATEGLTIWNASTVTLDTLGTISARSFDASSGTFNFLDGTLTVNGGTYSHDQRSLILNGGNASANPTLQLAGASAAVSADVFIGDDSNGTLEISNGGSLSNELGHIGFESGSTGTVSVDGSGSSWTNNDVLYVGLFGNGELNITGGGGVSNRDGFVGFSKGISGVVTVDGGGTWAQSNSLYLGGNEFGSGGMGTLTVSNFGRVDVADTLKVWGTGTLDAAAGGFVTTDSLSVVGGGTVASELGWIGLNGIGSAGIYTPSGGTATIDGSDSSWSINDSLRVGDSGVGTLQISDGGSVSSADGLVGNSPAGNGSVSVVGNGSNWINRNVLIVGDRGTGTLVISDGGSVSAHTGQVGVNNGDGTITIDGTGSALNVTDSLYIGGDATGNTGAGGLTATSGGSVDVTNTLKVWGSGLVNLAGGTLNSGNFDNEGIVAVSADSAIAGPASNSNNGRFDVSNSATLTFEDDFTHNGDRVHVGATSTVVFQGAVDGASDFTGTGNHVFEGSFSPGNSPALVSIAGDVEFGVNHTLMLELAGLTPGSEYDALSIDGAVTLGGVLQVDLLDGYLPGLGDTFDLISAETLIGTFDLLSLPDVDSRTRTWDLQYLYSSGTDILRLKRIPVSMPSVPLPPAVWLFGSGLIGLVAIGRRRRDAATV